MVEFTSKPQRSFSPFTLLTMMAVLAVAVVGVFLYVRHQQEAMPAEGKTAVVVPGLLRPGDTNFEYYKNKIKIENVKAGLGISFNKARFAMISGIIVNDGDRQLEALELHIKLYDVWGKLTKERTAFALRPGAGYSGNPMKPLEKRPFSIGIESVEYYWDPEEISYEITGLKYQ